ncbi:MAG: carbohydrate binding domain-containing protein [Lachnospiraceae bacterium]|nr:carbohydrate binding domain-containing protein [Lachnospiraceae bacterium]
MKKHTTRFFALCSGVLLLTAGCGKAGNTSEAPSTTPAPTEAVLTPEAPTAAATQAPTTAPTVAATQAPTATPKPTATPTPLPTAAPVYGKAGEVAAYDVSQSNYQLTIDASNAVHDISDLLYGIFIEDINFAADGGLYAEMVQNRSFEFTKLAAGDELHAWVTFGGAKATVIKDDTTGCLNQNNPNYLLLEAGEQADSGIYNKGFLDGMCIEAGKNYKFSVYARGLDAFTGPVEVTLRIGENIVATAAIPTVTAEWQKYELTLTPTESAHTNVRLMLSIADGSCALDMVSLFPEDTYLGRKNGLRKDLAEKLEALEPSFLRFPGGCVVEGVTLATAYDWKDSIGVDENRDPLLFNGTYGDVAARKQGQNIWTNENTSSDQYPSFMSYGLGFYEYFLLAEDIGAIGVPVINCGLCCMAQGNGSGPALGTAEFKRYIDDALDLVEFCRGDETTVWGAARVALGHPEPFELKYIGIGNEQHGSNFYSHYAAFVEAFAQARTENPELYEGIELMFSAGLDDGDSGYATYIAAYKEADRWLAANPDCDILDYTGAIDHHYYNPPEWFFSHVDYYDEKNYSRDTATMVDTLYGGAIPVFVGEFAAQSNTLKAALSEAAYMTGLERNGDIVRMAAYAPLFGNLTATHWSPDLIWFNNHTSTASVNYYVQQIFARNAGSALLASELLGAELPADTLNGKIGVGTWNTAAKFDDIVVTDNATGEILASCNFDDGEMTGWEKVSDGRWGVLDGRLVQASTTTNTGTYGNTGSALYFGDSSWTNYTYTVKATKTNGSEGFLIPFAVNDKNNNYFWNIGGWNNTVSCLQVVESGNKSGQIGSTVRDFTAKIGQTYELKIVVSDLNVKCYIDDVLYVDYTLSENTTAEAYQVVSTDETGDIILKLVNVTGREKTVAIHVSGKEIISETAVLEEVKGTSLSNDNILGQSPVVTLKTSELTGVSGQFNYTLPKYSVSVLRLKTK